MIITKSLPFTTSLRWLRGGILFIFVYIIIVSLLYRFDIVHISLPILPVTLIGTAVAFYVGFKNNNAYDRMWEARKIWGAIVNNSRSWAIAVDGYVSHIFNDQLKDEQLQSTKETLIRRHIGWLYQLRRQLLEVQPWEHAAQKNHEGRSGRMYQEHFGVGLYKEEAAQVGLENYVSPDELSRYANKANIATQLIAQQQKDLLALREHLIIDDFRHMEMTELLNQFYDDQGKCERINKFPLPRQYAVSARIFTYIFILILPFSVMPAIYQAVSGSNWASLIAVLLTALVTWVYYMMENVGDYSENPFQGMANDIPMLNMSRTIEIDMLQIIGEENTPPPIGPKNGILM